MKNHEKLHMFARDIIRVKNPLSKDFRFKFDSIWYTVPAGGTKDMERYLADKYVWDCYQHIVGEMIISEGNKALDNYLKMNPNLLLDKYAENRMVWDKIPRLDNQDLQRKVIRNLVVGLVEKFGEDQEVTVPQGKLDKQTPFYQELLNEFTHSPIGSVDQEDPSPAPQPAGSGTPASVVSTPADVSEVTQP